jgi:hypothetical protein
MSHFAAQVPCCISMLCTMIGLRTRLFTCWLQNPATGLLAERPALLDGLREVAPGHMRYQVSYCHYGAKMVRHSNCESPFPPSLPGARRLLPRKCVWAVADLAASTARWKTCRI